MIGSIVSFKLSLASAVQLDKKKGLENLYKGYLSQYCENISNAANHASALSGSGKSLSK